MGREGQGGGRLKPKPMLLHAARSHVPEARSGELEGCRKRRGAASSGLCEFQVTRRGEEEGAGRGRGGQDAAVGDAEKYSRGRRRRSGSAVPQRALQRDDGAAVRLTGARRHGHGAALTPHRPRGTDTDRRAGPSRHSSRSRRRPVGGDHVSACQRRDRQPVGHASARAAYLLGARPGRGEGGAAPAS